MMVLELPCLRLRTLSFVWTLPLMTTTGECHQCPVRHEARRDRFHCTRGRQPIPASVALQPLQILLPQHLTVTTTTRIEPIAGRSWRCKNTAVDFWNVCRGRPYRTEGLRRHHQAAPQQASLVPPLAKLPHLTRSRGRRQASCSRDRAWRKPRECFAANFVLNYWPNNQVSQAAPREQESGPSEERCWAPPGHWFSSWRINILQSPADNTGPTGSFKQLTTDALGGARLPPDCSSPVRYRARPRSLCACRFQCLRTLHPYGPSLPRRNHRPQPHHISPRHRTLPGADSPAAAASSSQGVMPSNSSHACQPAPLQFRKWPRAVCHLSPLASQSGPKSGSCLLKLLSVSLIAQAGGVRVPSDSASGGGLVVPAARKHRGPSPPEGPASPQQPPVFQLTHSVKRAFRRARLRAHNSPNQGTWYHGKWHTASSLGQLPQPLHRNPRRAQPHPSGWKRPVPHLHVLSWNASGLSSALFQEFMAWCELQSQLDVIVIQKTHWHSTTDFCSGPWLAMHTSGRDDPAGFGRCSGILFLLRRHKFQDPRILELLPGRLALVQATSKHTKLPLSLIGVYQHVWRSGLSTSRNQELRRGLWDKLDHTLLTTPQRHHVLICGDFNATLHAEPPVAGPSVVSTAGGHDSDLQALMQKHSMCAVNTWHASPSGTYFSSAGCTQIDYIFTRQSSASLQAKYAYPDHGFPVGGDRLSGHYPLRASLPLRSFCRSPPQDSQPAAAPINLPALQEAVHSATPKACAMQIRVARRLQQVDVTNLVSAHKQINCILLEEAAAAFPRQAPTDLRVSAQPEFRVSARSVWHLYHELKRPRVCTAPEIFAKWRLAVQFARASRLLKQQSRHLKRQFYETQVMQAEQAAQRGDQRSLHLIVKRLSPKQRNLACRLRGEDGHLLSSQEEMQHILAYSSKTFSAKLDDHPCLPLTQALTVTAQDMYRATLRRRQSGNCAPPN